MQQNRRNCNVNINVSRDTVNCNFFPFDHKKENSPPPSWSPSLSHAPEFRSGGLCVPQDRIEDVFQSFPSFEDNVMSLDGLLLSPGRDSRPSPDSKTDCRVHAYYPRNDCREVINIITQYSTKSTAAPKGRRTARTRRWRQGVPAAVSGIEEVVTSGPARKPLVVVGRRQCAHCQATNTPQWRGGPSGPNTLCNACGMRYKSGKLVPQYRPAASPTFNCAVHSNFHKRILRMKYG